MLERIYRNKHLEQFCGVGICNNKLEDNQGILFRTATLLGNVDFLFTLGNRYKYPRSDTVRSFKQLPCWHFEDIRDLEQHLPNACNMVAVDIHPKSQMLNIFNHPRRAIYLFGAEDNGIPKEWISRCRYKVQIPSQTQISMNLSSAGSILLWDRFLKMENK